MKCLPYSLLSVLLLPAFVPGFAQAGKPVLSADPAPPAVVAAPPATPGQASTDPSYIIGPDDSLDVIVWKEPNYSGHLTVRPDGMITIPLVGDIKAAGRTPPQLAADLTVQLGKFINLPNVNVNVLAVNSKRIYFFGSVARPGPMNLTPGMTIMQAIATAGGLTDFANKKKIVIIRGDPGHQKKILFDYTKAIKSLDMQGVTLQPGDQIVVQ